MNSRGRSPRKTLQWQATPKGSNIMVDDNVTSAEYFDPPNSLRTAVAHLNPSAFILSVRPLRGREHWWAVYRGLHPRLLKFIPFGDVEVASLHSL